MDLFCVGGHGTDMVVIVLLFGSQANPKSSYLLLLSATCSININSTRNNGKQQCGLSGTTFSTSER